MLRKLLRPRRRPATAITLYDPSHNIELRPAGYREGPTGRWRPAIFAVSLTTLRELWIGEQRYGTEIEAEIEARLHMARALSGLFASTPEQRTRRADPEGRSGFYVITATQRSAEARP